LIPETQPVEPIEASCPERLDIIPYVRSRLVFAEIAAHLLRKNDYDMILVDFPYFMNSPGWLENPIRLLPAVSLAIFGGNNQNLRAISFAPNDAASIAIYLATVHSLPFFCVDDSDLLNYPPNSIFSPRVSWGDDYRVYHLGLEGYFQPIWEQMDAAWPATTSQVKFFSRYRAQVVAKYLREAMKGKKKALFICEYQLWWSLRQFLHQEPREQVRYIFKWQNTPGVLRVEDPYFAWVYGLLDDYPAVNLEFWKSLQAGETNSFDKLQAWEKILTGALTGNYPTQRKIKKGKGLSIKVISILPFLKKKKKTSPKVKPISQISLRRLTNFLHYLKNLVVLHNRLLPEPGNHLFHAARACGDRSFQESLARELLHYPYPGGEQLNFILKNALVMWGGLGVAIPDYAGLASFYTGQPFSSFGGQVDQSCWDEEMAARRLTLEQIHQELSPDEKEELQRNQVHTGVRWEVTDDFRLHAQASRHLRFLVQARLRHYFPKRSWGKMEGGLHWKAILGALARGEKAVYVKHRTYSEDRFLTLDEHTPVVFLLAPEEEIDKSFCLCVHDSNLTQRHLELGLKSFRSKKCPDPDQVYSVLFTSRSTQNLLEGHVQQENLTSLCTLYTKHVMGVERYKAITRREAKHQCRYKPTNDPEIRSLPPSQLGIAWAIKYAKDAVMVAAPPGWQLPRVLQQYAQKKGIKIITVSLSSLQTGFVDRLSRCFFLSTTLKRHPRHEQIARRFIH